MFRAFLIVMSVAILAPAVANARYTTAMPPLPNPMPTVIHTMCGPSPDLFECYAPDSNTLWVDGSDGFNLNHGLGHAFDRSNLSDGERSRFMSLVSMHGAWVSGTGAAGNSSPNERFADAYASCRLRLDPDREWQASYNYNPTRAQHRKVCAFIKRAAG